jgi:hypothetical protein
MKLTANLQVKAFFSFLPCFAARLDGCPAAQSVV